MWVLAFVRDNAHLQNQQKELDDSDGEERALVSEVFVHEGAEYGPKNSSKAKRQLEGKNADFFDIVRI